MITLQLRKELEQDICWQKWIGWLQLIRMVVYGLADWILKIYKPQVYPKPIIKKLQSLEWFRTNLFFLMIEIFTSLLTTRF
jgi:hypothetical protein